MVKCAYKHKYGYTHKHTRTHTYIHTHAHARIHTHKQTHTHTHSKLFAMMSRVLTEERQCFTVNCELFAPNSHPRKRLFTLTCLLIDGSTAIDVNTSHIHISRSLVTDNALNTRHLNLKVNTSNILCDEA